MRVLHVVETLHVGGLERVVIDLVKEQSSRGNQCLVICLFEKGRLANELIDTEVSLEVCGKRSGIDFKAINKLSKQIKAFNPDVIHTHNVVCNYYICFAKTWAFSNVKVINSRHGIGRGKIVVKEQMLFGVSLLFTRWVVGVCDVTRDKLQHEYPLFKHKIVTVPNGIVLEKFRRRNSVDKQKVLYELGIEGDVILICIVARLNIVKNHSLLLQAFAQTQNTDLTLVIIGGGELMENLQHLSDELKLNKKVFFLGDRNDVTDLLSGMDLFVLCSKMEGYSISLLEACASGLPIIATDVGGNKEIVKNEYGKIVPSDNVTALSDSIASMTFNVDKLHKMGELARNWVEKNGTVEVMANKYDELYKL